MHFKNFVFVFVCRGVQPLRLRVRQRHCMDVEMELTIFVRQQQCMDEEICTPNSSNSAICLQEEMVLAKICRQQVRAGYLDTSGRPKAEKLSPKTGFTSK